jgi:hypothetical protein
MGVAPDSDESDRPGAADIGDPGATPGRWSRGSSSILIFTGRSSRTTRGTHVSCHVDHLGDTASLGDRHQPNSCPIHGKWFTGRGDVAWPGVVNALVFDPMVRCGRVRDGLPLALPGSVARYGALTSELAAMVKYACNSSASPGVRSVAWTMRSTAPRI